jgi:hypothetical protein
VERTVETVLLPAVEALAEDDPSLCADPLYRDNRDETAVHRLAGSPEYCFAWRYATGWLAAALRVAPPATRDEGVLVFDASPPHHIDALHVQALELLLRRAGLRTLALPVDLDSERVGNAIRALRPNAVVLGGRSSSLEAIGRVVYSTRQTAGGLVVFDYRGALPDTGASTVPRIGPGPGEAVHTIRELLSAPAYALHATVAAGSASRAAHSRR